MTVSPNRPQDGNLPPVAGGSGVEPNDRSSLANLPPTLFRLPNLSMQQATARGETDRQPHESLQFDSETETMGHDVPAGPVASQFSDDELGMADQRGRIAGIDAVAGLFGDDVGEMISRGVLELGSRSAPVLSETGSTRHTDCRFGDSFVTAAPETVGDSRSRSLPAPSPASSAFQADVVEPLSAHTVASTEPASQTKPVASTPSRPPIPDAPAGRSWMESLGSHGVVIVLLLVVVAAALLTGKGEEDPSATSLTTQSELLNFDDLAADLPFPTADTDVARADVLPAESFQGTSQSDPGVSDSQVATTESAAASLPVTATPAAPTTPPSLDQTPESVASQPSVEASPTPTVSLDNPLPVKVQTFEPQSGEALASNGVQTNHFMFPNSGIEAKTVSDRDVNAAATDASLPSLEQLQGLQSPVGNQSQPNPGTPTRVLTKTPAGIADWSKYLPPLNIAAEPDAGTSSFNN